MTKPGYKELEEELRSLRDESLLRSRIEAEFLEKQSILRNQNISLVKKSIELSDIMRQLEDKNYELERSRSELEMALTALRESAERFRDLAELLPQPVFEFDIEGNVTYANRRGVDTFGYTQEEIERGLNSLQMFIPEDRQRVRENIRQGLTGQDFEDHEYTGLRKDGTTFPLLIYTAAIVRGHRPAGVRGIVLDITERKQAEEALERSSERIKMFAYSVSHDLKSPAVGIYGLTRLLQKHYSDVLDERGKNYCDQILKAAEQIAVLVGNINIYISTKEIPPSIEGVKLAELLQMVRDEFSAQMDVREIGWWQPESLPEIRVDRLSLLRVLRNLVDNALKHGGDDLSEIRIAYEGSDEFHTLSVSNDGVGINREDCEKIFGAFQRHETSMAVEGTGLGLAIVKEIAEQHGGKVWVEAGPKDGPAFYISISRRL